MRKREDRGWGGGEGEGVEEKGEGVEEERGKEWKRTGEGVEEKGEGVDSLVPRLSP